MNLLWHEGALGDLLLSRLAIAALSEEETALVARSEARMLFPKAGLVRQTASTEWGPPPHWDPPETLHLFGEGTALRETLSRRFPRTRIHTIRTRPRKRLHVALFQWLEAGGAPEALHRARVLRLPDFSRRPDYLLVHPGSGGRAKCYPAERLREALKLLGDIPLRIILGPAEEDLASCFSDFSLIRSLDLEEALSALSGAGAFLGNDSGLTHLAAALGVPVLALFGPTDPALWAPFGERVRVLYPFTKLSPKDLAREIERFLSTTPRSRPRTNSLPGEESPADAEPRPPEDEEPKRKTAEGPEHRFEGFAGPVFLGVEVVAVEGEEPR